MGNSTTKKNHAIEVPPVTPATPATPATPNPLSVGNKSSPNLSHLSLDPQQRSASRTKSKSDIKNYFAFASRSLIDRLQEDTKTEPNPLGISHKIIGSLYIFWRRNVDTCPVQQKLEMSVLIFFIMMESCGADFRDMFKHKKIEDVSLWFLSTITNHIRSLVNQEPMDLKLIGKLHKQSGVKLEFYASYLSALHLTLSEYFPNKYSIEIKHCLDLVFINTVRVMLGKKPLCRNTDAQSDDTSDELPTSTPSTTTSRFSATSMLRHWNEARSMTRSSVWLRDLAACFESDIGREYFFRFLEQTMCYEIVIFFKLYLEFTKSNNEEEKFVLLRQIGKICIDIHDISPFPINISYETKQDFIKRTQLLEYEWKKQHGHLRCSSVLEPVSLLFDDNACNVPTLSLPATMAPSNSFSRSSSLSRRVKVPNDFLDTTFLEMKRLAMQNHWRQFCSRIHTMSNVSEGSVSASIKYFE